MTGTDLWGLSLAQLEKLLAGWGEPSYRARQIYDWLYRRLVCSVDEMTNLPVDLRQRLNAETVIGTIKTSKCQHSSDNSAIKLLFSLADKETVEGVLLKYDKWYSACISSQAGCKMGCAFCASALGGWARNLTPGES